MKQCPKKCEMCGAPIVDVGAIIAIDGLPDVAHQVWTCNRKGCNEKAVLQVDRGHPRYVGVRGIQPDGTGGLVPDVDHPLRGEIVVHVQQVKRVDIELISRNMRIVT